MKQYYNDGQIKIYHGDAFEVLSDPGFTLPFDLVLTDPPYELSDAKPGKSTLSHLEKFHSDEYRNITDGFDSGRLFYHIRNRLGEQDNPEQYYFFCSHKQIPELSEYAIAYGFSFNVLVWYKPNAVPFANGVWKNDLEYIVHIRETGGYFEGDSKLKSKIFEHPIVVDQSHPTVKPMPLLKKFLQISCPPGGTVLDPFTGSGTTLRAAKDLGMKAIGIELEEKYCQVAADRCIQEVLL